VNHRLAAVLSLVFASAALSSCGGGSGITPPPPSGSFSSASLHGQYAFSLNGVDLNGAYIARIGSFTADGAGSITSGLEDVLALGSGQPASTVSFTGGTYQIQPNGRGTLTLNAAGGALQMSLVMQSAANGYAIQTDLAASTSGTFTQQTSTDFNAAALANPYVFGASGLSFANSNAAPLSLLGKIVADGNGNITSGVIDTNDGNASAPSGATPVSTGTYALDTNGNGTNFGRGTMTFNARTFAFYIVDATHFEILEEDGLGGSSGEALQQTGAIPTQNSEFTGSFVYLIGGVSSLGSQGPIARGGRFTADGNGGISSISFDDNSDGTYRHISQGSNISAATYTIDSTNAGSGRGSFTFTDSGGGTYADVFYLRSATQAMVQETTKGIVGTGSMYAQTGSPFTVAASAGTYVSNWTGVQLGTNSAIPFEEDFVNQFTLSNANSSNIAGAVDYVELGLSSKTLFTSVGLGGTLTIDKDGTNNNLYKFAVAGSPSITINFQAYFANPSTVLLICSDSIRTTAGVIHPQQ